MNEQTILTFEPHTPPSKSAIIIFVGIVKNGLCGFFNGIKNYLLFWLEIGQLR